MLDLGSWVSGSYELIKIVDPRKFDYRKFAGLADPLPPKLPTPAKVTMWEVANCARYSIRLAGFLGASAVVLGAYGAHTLLANPDPNLDEAKKVFETANRYHFYHSIALLAAPLARYPKVTSIFLMMGMVMFCGPLYLQTLRQDSRFRHVTPFGGTSLIIAWLTFLI
uniref:Transmembrane protein 256 n=1 Tax=Cacopsylla melanoneura TaxID=428564 RepID=A0A8D8UXB9_9HEMI